MFAIVIHKAQQPHKLNPPYNEYVMKKIILTLLITAFVGISVPVFANAQMTESQESMSITIQNAIINEILTSNNSEKIDLLRDLLIKVGTSSTDSSRSRTPGCINTVGYGWWGLRDGIQYLRKTYRQYCNGTLTIVSLSPIEPVDISS